MEGIFIFYPYSSKYTNIEFQMVFSFLCWLSQNHSSFAFSNGLKKSMDIDFVHLFEIPQALKESNATW